MAGCDVVLRPPDQIGARRRCLFPQGEPGEPSVCEQHHAGFEPLDQDLRQRQLRRRVGAELGVEDRVRSALRQSNESGLGKGRTLTLVHPGTTEELVVCDAVRHVERGAVDRDQPPARQPRPRRVRCRQRLRDPVEQRLDRLRPETFAGLEDRRLRRQLHRLSARRPRQAVGQQAQHVLIGTLRMQGHPHREVRHRLRRQRPMPLLLAARRRDHVIDHRRRKRTSQQPDRHQIRQPGFRYGLRPTSTGHHRQTTRL